MARTVRRCPTAWLQPECAEELERNPNVPQHEEQPDVTKGEVIVDYNLDVDYKGQNLRMSQLLRKKRRKTLM